MGLGGISIWQLLIVLAIVIMIFGTKRLRSLGSDLGSAVKGFKQGLQDEPAAQGKPPADSEVIGDSAPQQRTGASGENPGSSAEQRGDERRS